MNRDIAGVYLLNTAGIGLNVAANGQVQVLEGEALQRVLTKLETTLDKMNNKPTSRMPTATAGSTR